MKRAKIFAAVIYSMLVVGAMTFVHYPVLEAEALQAHVTEANIKPDQARDVALRAVPGTVKSDELETEHGRLIYSFEIERPGQRGITEVNVNAQDGSIVDVHSEHASSRRVNKAQKAQQCENLDPDSASEYDLL
jgi:hypothetical protein